MLTLSGVSVNIEQCVLLSRATIPHEREIVENRDAAALRTKQGSSDFTRKPILSLFAITVSENCGVYHVKLKYYCAKITI